MRVVDLLSVPTHASLVTRLVSDASALRFVDEYLRSRAARFDGVVDALDADVLLLLWRLACDRDGGDGGDAANERLGALLYEKRIFDVPKLYAMCVVWAQPGLSAEGDAATCADIVKALLRLQPRSYLEDVDRSVVAAVEALDEVAVAAASAAPRSRALSAAASALAATATSLSALLAVAPTALACHFLPPMSIHYVGALRSAYEATLPALLRSAEGDAATLSTLRVARGALIGALHGALDAPLRRAGRRRSRGGDGAASDDVDDVDPDCTPAVCAHSASAALDALMEGATLAGSGPLQSMLREYDVATTPPSGSGPSPLCSAISRAAGAAAENADVAAALRRVVVALRTAAISAGSATTSLKPSAASWTPRGGAAGSVPPRTQPQPQPQEEPAAKAKAANARAALHSAVNSVRAVLPHLEEDFVAALLQHDAVGGNAERAISCVLEGRVPDDIHAAVAAAAALAAAPAAAAAAAAPRQPQRQKKKQQQKKQQQSQRRSARDVAFGRPLRQLSGPRPARGPTPRDADPSERAHLKARLLELARNLEYDDDYDDAFDAPTVGVDDGGGADVGESDRSLSQRFASNPNHERSRGARTEAERLLTEADFDLDAVRERSAEAQRALVVAQQAMDELPPWCGAQERAALLRSYERAKAIAKRAVAAEANAVDVEAHAARAAKGGGGGGSGSGGRGGKGGGKGRGKGGRSGKSGSSSGSRGRGRSHSRGGGNQKKGGRGGGNRSRAKKDKNKAAVGNHSRKRAAGRKAV